MVVVPRRPSRSSATACGSAGPIASPTWRMLFGLPGKLTISVRPRMPATARDSIQLRGVRPRRRAHRLGDAGSLAVDHGASRLGRHVVGREAGAAGRQDEVAALRCRRSGAAPTRSCAARRGRSRSPAISAPSSRANSASAGPLSSAPWPSAQRGADRDDRGAHPQPQVTALASSRRLPPVFSSRATSLDRDAALDALDHVVDGQRGDRAGGQRLHLDAGPGGRARLADERDGARRGSISASTSTNVSGSGCASGISSSVRFAAWMPAIRAVPSTSPLGASPRCDERGCLRRSCARRRAHARGGRSPAWRPRRPCAPGRARRGG